MEFINFLIQAKKQTYANENNQNEKINSDNSKELFFKKNQFKYIDKYYGFNPFIGEEIIWENDTIIWGMNYYGQTFTTEKNPKEIFTFLKKAMSQISTQNPFRGPEIFEKNYFKYTNKSSGTIENFSGIEKIYYKERKIYELTYHGGTIHKK